MINVMIVSIIAAVDKIFNSKLELGKNLMKELSP